MQTVTEILATVLDDKEIGYWHGIPFGQGALKSTTQGVIFDLLLYVTFDCAVFVALCTSIYECPTFSQVQQYQYCCSHFTFSNTHIIEVESNTWSVILLEVLQLQKPGPL